MAADGRPFCTQCGHACHCARGAGSGECSFWEPGSFTWNSSFEWCQHVACVHGKPEDLAQCNRCHVTVLYKHAGKHDCRLVAAEKEQR